MEGYYWMRFNTFFQICIYIVLACIILTLSINFVVSLGIFGDYSAETGIQSQKTANETLAQFTKSGDYKTGFLTTDLWSFVLAGIAVAAGAAVVAWITHSASVLGVGVFAYVFWASYVNVISILQVGGFLADLGLFVLIGTVGMGFIFIGAVIGMLSGSG